MPEASQGSGAPPASTGSTGGEGGSFFSESTPTGGSGQGPAPASGAAPTPGVEGSNGSAGSSTAAWDYNGWRAKPGWDTLPEDVRTFAQTHLGDSATLKGEIAQLQRQLEIYEALEIGEDDPRVKETEEKLKKREEELSAERDEWKTKYTTLEQQVAEQWADQFSREHPWLDTGTAEKPNPEFDADANTRFWGLVTLCQGKPHDASVLAKLARFPEKQGEIEKLINENVPQHYIPRILNIDLDKPPRKAGGAPAPAPPAAAPPPATPPGPPAGGPPRLARPAAQMGGGFTPPRSAPAPLPAAPPTYENALDRAAGNNVKRFASRG